MNIYMLDTSICTYILKYKTPSVRSKLTKLKSTTVGVSIVTSAELMYAAERSGKVKVKRLVEDFLSRLQVFGQCDDFASAYAKMKHEAEKKNAVYHEKDLIVASQARIANAVIVTMDKNRYGFVNDIKIEEWK